MITVDTSVAVPLLASWHERHRVVAAALDAQDIRLGAHVAVETFSVLSRLPGGRGLAPADCWTLLGDRFGPAWLALPASGHRRLLERLAAAGIGGGAAYDGLVAATARHHAARLVSLDQRAGPIYRLIGADVVLVG